MKMVKVQMYDRDRAICPDCGGHNTSAKVQQYKRFHFILGLINVVDVGWFCDDCCCTFGYALNSEVLNTVN